MGRYKLPPQLIAEIASILAGRAISNAGLENDFIRAGAPPSVPAGSMLPKATTWLERISDDDSIDSLQVLGRLIEDLMDRGRGPDEPRDRVRRALATHNLSYEPGGRILGGTLSTPTKTLADHIRARDREAINRDFERALSSIEIDPPAALTAASSVLETTFTTYIEEKGLIMPPDRSIQPLWKVVRQHLGLEAGQIADADMRKVMGGLASIVDGVGALRTHAGTAHGHGQDQPRIEPRHARLAVHAAHTVVDFVLESWG